MKVLSLLLILALASMESFAQNDSTRVEIPIRPNQSRPMVIPMDEMGFVVIDQNQANILEPSNVISLTGYDTSMKRKWDQVITYGRRLSLQLYEYQAGKLYLIYGNQQREEREFYVIDPKTGRVDQYDFFYLDNLSAKDFVVISQQVYILGTLKRLPVLLEFDLKTKKVAPFSLAIDAKDVEVLEVISEGERQVSATISIEVNKRKQLLTKTFDIITKEGQEFVVKPSDEYDLLNGKVTSLNEHDKLVIGTYGFRNRLESQGMFVGGYVGGREVIKKYHRFTEMNNFFGFLSENEQQRIANKISKKSKKGKELKLRYRLLVHEAIVHNDEYIMLGEAYYPTYRTERYRRYGPRGYYYDTRTVFDGYKFTHAVVAAINKRGDLSWDNSFKINDTKTFQLKERVKLLVKEETLTLIYNIEGEVYQLQIKNGKEIEGTRSDLLAKKHDHDRVKLSDTGDAEYWYDNNFLVWGYQKIKNYEGEGDKIKRNVFYINKLSY